MIDMSKRLRQKLQTYSMVGAGAFSVARRRVDASVHRASARVEREVVREDTRVAMMMMRRCIREMRQ